MVKVFNSVYVTPSAKAFLVGGIGEIEIEEMGIGYSAGNLRIEDLSGSGARRLIKSIIWEELFPLKYFLRELITVLKIR